MQIAGRDVGTHPDGVGALIGVTGLSWATEFRRTR
jgi:hypothetical protein